MIAVFYTDKIKVIPLLAALIPLLIFALLVQRRIRSWWLLIPLAVLTWVFVHESGVHATVAVCCWASRCRCCAANATAATPRIGETAGVGPDAGPGWPSTSST